MKTFTKIKKYQLIDLVILEIFTVIFISLVFPGIPKFASWEGSPIMNLPRVKIIADNLPYIPQWNPYWYFGSPILRFYPPLFYYTMALVTWISQIDVLNAFIIYTHIIFSIGVLSVYLLGRETGLGRLGSFTSAILFLTASNIWIYWDAGSTENILAVLLAIPSILLLFRAFKKPSILNIVASGMLISTTYLTHLANAYIFTIIIGGICIVWIAVERKIIFIKTMFKVMIPCVIIVLGLTLFWYLPFFNQGGFDKFLNLGLLPTGGSPMGTSIFTQTQAFLSQLSDVIGFKFARNLWSPGFGHFFLAIAGIVFAFKDKQKMPMISAGLFLVTFASCFSVYLQLPLSLPYRFSPYLSIFAAICGGYAIDRIGTQYLYATRDRTMSIFISGLLLIVAVYPSIDGISKLYANRPLETEETQELIWLSEHAEEGEWIATDDLYYEWRINIYTSFGQAGGTDLYARTNRFAHTFWYYILNRQNAQYLPYMTRNFNVKHILFNRIPELEGIENIDSKLYEISNFDSSFVEVVGKDELTVLFFGDSEDYVRLFESLAPMNATDILLINGGEYIEDYEDDSIQLFDVIYSDGLRYRNLTVLSELVVEFVEGGGGVILDTGNFPYGGNMDDVPRPFPVAETEFTILSMLLNETQPNNVTAGIDFTKFTNGTYHASSADIIKTGGVSLLEDQNRSVLVYWKYGSGQVMWCGLRLNYHSQLEKNLEEMKLIESMIRNVTINSGVTAYGSATFDLVNPDNLTVEVEDADADDMVWIKMSYYNGWKATIEGRELKMFLAGPNMMLFHPDINGDYIIRLVFEKTLDVQVGEATSTVTLVILLIIAVFFSIKEWQRKNKMKEQRAIFGG